jgi:hypothetical protein
MTVTTTDEDGLRVALGAAAPQTQLGSVILSASGMALLCGTKQQERCH